MSPHAPLAMARALRFDLSNRIRSTAAITAESGHDRVGCHVWLPSWRNHHGY